MLFSDINNWVNFSGVEISSLVILLFGVAVLMGGVSLVLIKSLKKKKDQEDDMTNNV